VIFFKRVLQEVTFYSIIYSIKVLSGRVKLNSKEKL
jgi:hypothetical protein